MKRPSDTRPSAEIVAEAEELLAAIAREAGSREIDEIVDMAGHAY